MAPVSTENTGVVLLDLRQVADHCTLSQGLCASYAEAARVMLDKYHQVPPPRTAARVLRNTGELLAELAWEEPSPQERESHANEKDATEDGAYGVAIVAVRAIEPRYLVRRRIHHGSGADFIMTIVNEPENDFVKLEVSGTTHDEAVPGRLRGKIEQVAGGDLDRPGVAVVVSFPSAIIAMHRHDK